MMAEPVADLRRHVGDPVITLHGLKRDMRDAERAACLYGAAMMIKTGRLPSDMLAVDVHFIPPATTVFIAADGTQRELGRYVVPDRVLTYDPRPIALPPAEVA